jgi:hypothetical protein
MTYITCLKVNERDRSLLFNPVRHMRQSKGLSVELTDHTLRISDPGDVEKVIKELESYIVPDLSHIAQRFRRMPTIRESIQAALEALANSGFPPGGAVYDDLAQSLKDLEAGASLDDKLTA